MSLGLIALAVIGYASAGGLSSFGNYCYYGYGYEYCPPPTTTAPPPPPPPPLVPCKVTGGGEIPTFNTFGFVAMPRDPGAHGSLKYQDHTLGLNVKSVSLSSVGCESPTSATFTGTARVNGGATQTFTVHVTDLAEPGAGVDTFSIVLSGGYSRSGTLTGGNIQIHL